MLSYKICMTRDSLDIWSVCSHWFLATEDCVIIAVKFTKWLDQFINANQSRDLESSVFSAVQDQIQMASCRSIFRKIILPLQFSSCIKGINLRKKRRPSTTRLQLNSVHFMTSCLFKARDSWSSVRKSALKLIWLLSVLLSSTISCLLPWLFLLTDWLTISMYFTVRCVTTSERQHNGYSWRTFSGPFPRRKSSIQRTWKTSRVWSRYQPRISLGANLQSSQSNRKP